MAKATSGNFFEDFSLGQRLQHATPRTIHGGDLALYIGLYGDRRPLHSSAEFAKALGYRRESAHDLLVFHIVMGKTVNDVSKNAVANLGYADMRFLCPVYPGDTLRAESEVIGLRETGNGKAGIVYVTTRGMNGSDQEVLRYHRWVMVHKRDAATPTGERHVPSLPEAVPAAELPVPAELEVARFAEHAWATGGAALWDDYAVGERIDHIDGMTLDEVDHTTATKLYQNTARVHFDLHQMKDSRFGRRLIYGGHVISVAHALAMNGLENVLVMAAWNGGAHANPSFAGDTIYAWSEVLDKAVLPGRADLGALRLRLVAVKNVDPTRAPVPLKVTGADGKEAYDERVVLDLDTWGLIPRRPVGR
jgi:2-methylfumaryl-CoA hydratase